MFRRKRSASQHHHTLSTSSTQSAQSAATHAFLKSQPSANSLSSAAAAAALRSLTPTPTPVENVQTKRMLQRQASLSSPTGIASGLRPSSRNGLRRANSSGSMSARTFRDQSPHRPASSSGPGRVAPPLPAIPQEYTARRNQTRRSVSLGPSVWSSLPGKEFSETATSMDDGTKGPGHPPSTNTSGSISPEHQRSGSRNSINFSYPMNPRTNSPTMPSGLPDRRDTAIGTLPASHPLPSEAAQNKSPVLPPSRRAGRHKSRGSGPGSPGRGPPAAGTALAAAQAAVVHRNDEPNTPPTSPYVVRQRDPTVPDQSPNRGPVAADPKPRAGPTIVKRPSTVVEDRQAEEDHSEIAIQGRQGVNTVPTGKTSPEERPGASTPPVTERAPGSLHSPLVDTPESSRSTDPGQEPQIPHPRQSSSPGRTARFSTRLSVMNYPGEHLHQPLGRSVSPAKPALKHPRKNSVSPDGRIHGVLRVGPLLSELSDATSVGSDDGVRPNYRKRAVKVSFDDEAEVVGVAASPPTSPEDAIPESPPGMNRSKANWFPFNKRKTSPVRPKEADTFDEMLRPRPALPSFGSIRAGRDGGLREMIHQDFSDNESTASSESNSEMPVWSFSNDHAIGSIISRAAQENADAGTQLADTQHAKHPEEQAENYKENIPVDKPDLPAGYTNKEPVSLAPDAQPPAHQILTPNPNLAIPDITVQPATPGVEKGRPSLEGYDVPGGFPRTSVDFESTVSSSKKGKRRSTGTVEGEITPDTAGRGESDDDESSESIYSDAEEDLNNGDGFGSINAILDGESALSQAQVPEQQETSHSNPQVECDPNEPELPEPCRIARVLTPTTNNVYFPSSVPESPDSSNEPLPFSSPYPPFPVEPGKRRQGTLQGRIPRSSTMPANITNDPPSVAIHTIAQVTHSSHRQENVPLSHTIEYEVPSLRGDGNQARDPMRPVSWGPTSMKGKARLQGGEVHLNGKSAPVPQRPLSNGSDSSSSFKRSSRPSRGDTQYSMRRTLRGSQGAVPPSSPGRPTGPSAESRPLSSGSGAGSMRKTLRGSNPKPGKASFFSANRTQKGRPGKPPGTPFTSRFADSDSESDRGIMNRRLQRRRKNLSDEDLRPVRGIPRRQGAHDGDSTELEDSSDNERHAAPTPQKPAHRSNRSAPPPRDPALAAVAKSRGMSEEELEQLLNQPRGGRRPSLLHRLSIRKPRLSGERGAPKFHADDWSQNGTLYEQADHESQNNSSPRLVKKASQKSSGAETWPFPSDQPESTSLGAPTSPPTASQQPQRPQTSDGYDPTSSVSNAKEQPLDEEHQSATNGNRISDVVIATGRRKRFSRFKKAFGLDK